MCTQMIQSEKIPTSQLNLTDQPKEVQESEKNECPTENTGEKSYW